MVSILNFRKGAFFIIIPMLLLTAACRQQTNTSLSNADDNGGYASDASRIELANNDAISLADAAGTVYNGFYMRSSRVTIDGTCATVATDTISVPHVLTIRFGSEDCQCLDGRKRKGTIIISYNGNYIDTAQVHTITFSNYFLNDNQLSGTIQTTRVDTTVTGNWYYQVQVNDTMNVSQDPLNSQLVLWQGNFVRKWLSGYNSSDRSAEAFSIAGSAVLTRPNGHVFNFGISTPLQIAIGCDFAESGVVNVSGYTGVRVLNYGSGTCDDNAQVNISGNVNPIILTK